MADYDDTKSILKANIFSKKKKKKKKQQNVAFSGLLDMSLNFFGPHFSYL